MKRKLRDDDERADTRLDTTVRQVQGSAGICDSRQQVK